MGKSTGKNPSFIIFSAFIGFVATISYVFYFFDFEGQHWQHDARLWFGTYCWIIAVALFFAAKKPGMFIRETEVFKGVAYYARAKRDWVNMLLFIIFLIVLFSAPLVFSPDVNFAIVASVKTWLLILAIPVFLAYWTWAKNKARLIIFEDGTVEITTLKGEFIPWRKRFKLAEIDKLRLRVLISMKSSARMKKKEVKAKVLEELADNPITSKKRKFTLSRYRVDYQLTRIGFIVNGNHFDYEFFDPLKIDELAKVIDWENYPIEIKSQFVLRR